MPVGIASGAVVEGFFQGIIPIGYIVMMAVLLYKITVESGQFLTIQDSITNISQDQRIQVFYWLHSTHFRRCSRIWCTNCNLCTFINTIRFNPLKAAMLCLVANAASGAFGAIGIPVGVVETLKLPGDVSVLGVSQSATLTLAIINFIIPFLLIFIIDGFRGVKETLPAILVVSITYTLTQGLLTVFSGPELADIIPVINNVSISSIF